MDRRINKLNMKISSFERNELNRIIAEEGKNLSDVIRKAIRQTYNVEGFESSYEGTSKFTNEGKRRKSIYDLKG